MTKLIIDPETERILGVGIAGSGAGELIAEGVLAIEMGATASDLKLSIHPHPTLTETLMEVGRSVLRPGDARLQAEEKDRRAVASAKADRSGGSFEVRRSAKVEDSPVRDRMAAMTWRWFAAVVVSWLIVVGRSISPDYPRQESSRR